MDVSSLEIQILESVMLPDDPAVSVPRAKVLREIRFSDSQLREIDRLLSKNNAGTITPKQRSRLESYVRIGEILGVLRAKAQLQLQQRARKA